MTPARKWLVVVLVLNLGVFVWRLVSNNSTRYAQLFRLQNLMVIQLFMALASTLIYRKLLSLVLRQSSNLRWVVRLSTLFFIGMAHFSWFCYYIFLPDSSILALLSFISVSIYAHLAVFLLASICVEAVSGLIFPDASIFLLKSKSFHTFLSLCMALAFTGAGIIVTQREPLVQHQNVYVPDLASELDGFTIGLVTDVHIGPTVGRRRVETVVRLMNSMDADVITVVGDLVDGFVTNLAQRAAPMRNLHAHYGKFFVTGNHEYYHEDVNNWIKFFRSDLNLTVLRNSHEVIRPTKTKFLSPIEEENVNDGYSSICIVGVDDLVTESLFIKGHKMDAQKAMSDCPSNSVLVVLAHQPNAARKIIDESKRHIHLILSGHTHGGQFYIFRPLAYWRNAFLHGLYRDSSTDTQVFVSSGVNYWGPPVKIWNGCEVVLLRLRKGRQAMITELNDHSSISY